MTSNDNQATTDKSLSSSPSLKSSSLSLLERPLFVFNFAPVPHVYSICPFALKLESFLRINKVPYESVYGGSLGSKGMMPYIRLDHPDKDIGEEIADSNVVLARLCQELEARTPTTYSEATLTPQQRAMTHFVIRMLEEHTQQIGFYYRYGLHMMEFMDSLDIEHRFRPGVYKVWGERQPDTTKQKTKYRGLSRHSDEEIWTFSNDDIQALSDTLGDNTYMLGGSSPTLLDCAVFGHLSQFLWIPINFPQRQYMLDRCPNLVTFMNGFRSKYWPDWDELCALSLDYTHEKPSLRKKHTIHLSSDYGK